MGKLVRMITSDGAVMGIGLESTDIVAQAEAYHKTSAVMTAALGRLLTAASMMGHMLKGEKDTITLRITGDGPAKAVVAVADSEGNVRGYTTDPVVEIPLKPNGKLDVSGAIGQSGTLYVIKDIGLKEPYSGSIPLVSGEVAEDITAYYAISEQIPTVCALGVLVNPDLSVRCAGGYILQLLPGADDQTIDRLEETVRHIRPVTAMLDDGMDMEAILKEALTGFDTEVLYTSATAYRCPCGKERVKHMLLSLEEKELRDMAAEMPVVEVSCHFCNKTYSFTPKEIEKMADLKKV